MALQYIHRCFTEIIQCIHTYFGIALQLARCCSPVKPSGPLCTALVARLHVVLLFPAHVLDVWRWIGQAANSCLLQVQLANDCEFGLGSSTFSGDQARAARIGSQIKAGMFVVNDFATYSMCQSLPFGGVRESGFDRYDFLLFMLPHPSHLGNASLSNGLMLLPEMPLS